MLTLKASDHVVHSSRINPSRVDTIDITWFNGQLIEIFWSKHIVQGLKSPQQWKSHKKFPKLLGDESSSLRKFFMLCGCCTNTLNEE